MSQSNTVVRVFKYRLYPSKAQERNLFRVLNATRHLYNMALEQRKLAWEFENRTVTLLELDMLARHYRAKMPYGQQMYSQTAQSIIRQLQLAFESFFRRVKAGQTPGYPRFKQRTQFNSFVFPQYERGASMDGRRLKLFGIGRVAVRWHRPIEGKIKTVRIIHKAGQWFVAFACEVAKLPPLPKTGRMIGVDVGIVSLITTSEGDKVDHPSFYRLAQKRLRVLQRAVEGKKKGGRNRHRAMLRVQRQHMHVANQRQDVLHKLSTALIESFDGMALEELRVRNMVKNRHLSKSILDSGWAMFKQFLVYKAGSAGREIRLVNPAYTSKCCSGCGQMFEDFSLSTRWVNCECGLSLDRDHNAAINILRKAGWDAPVQANVERG
jgi:putative transposase